MNTLFGIDSDIAVKPATRPRRIKNRNPYNVARAIVNWFAYMDQLTRERGVGAVLAFIERDPRLLDNYYEWTSDERLLAIQENEIMRLIATNQAAQCGMAYGEGRRYCRAEWITEAERCLKGDPSNRSWVKTIIQSDKVF